jgi:hypothetical protein
VIAAISEMNSVNCVPLKKLILEAFTEENGRFFYSFEVSPKEGLRVDEFEVLKTKPLFVNVTWIGDQNLKYGSIQASPAFQLGKSMRNFSNVVNTVTCFKLEEHHVDEIVSGSEKLSNFTILRGGESFFDDCIVIFIMCTCNYRYR